MRLVLCGEGPAEPTTALTWYLEHCPPTRDDPVELLFGVRRAPVTLPPLPHLTVSTFMPGRGLRGLDVTPRALAYSAICRALRDGTLRPDAVIACATPHAGGWSLGGVDGYLQLALDTGPRIVVQETPGLSRVPGAARVSRADTVVPGPPLGAVIPLAGAPDELDTGIAARVAALVPDAATIALGVGRVAAATAALLADRCGLRVVTGAVTDATRALHDAGAIDPQTPVEAMSVIGDAALLAWAAESRVRLRPSTVVHCADHLASIPRFVAVLGSLAVGADGSLAAHRIGGRDVSGLGGAPDLAAGAHRSLGGLTVAALRSRDRHGRPALVDAVEAVTVAGEQVDAVVTERGTALLHGLSDGRRRAALEAVFQASPIRQHRC